MPNLQETKVGASKHISHRLTIRQADHSIARSEVKESSSHGDVRDTEDAGREARMRLPDNRLPSEANKPGLAASRRGRLRQAAQNSVEVTHNWSQCSSASTADFH